METENPVPTKRRRVGKIILWSIGVLILILGGVSYYVYYNFNHLVSDALIRAFNSGIISNVYELKIKNINVNLVNKSIQVHDVELIPREKPLVNYPYINSSFQLHTQQIVLTNVDIPTLLKSNILKLEKIDIIEPDIEVKLSGSRYILFPFRDSTELANKPESQKGFITSYLLKEFGLVDASLHMVNATRKREFTIKKFSIALHDLLIDQYLRMNIISNKTLELSMGEITWKLKDDPIDYLTIKDYSIKLDSLKISNSTDTTSYLFQNFTTGLKSLEMQTADSLFHFTMASFKLSYRDSSIMLKGIAFKPNMSNAALQRRFVYQTPIFSGSVGTLKLIGLNFDSLIYRDKILIDAVELDKLAVNIFKDQSKPIDKKKFPKYPGQQIGSINIPLMIKQLRGTNVSLINSEKKPDGDVGRVHINRMTLEAKNITTLPTNKPLSVSADAYIEDKAHAFLALQFSYTSPQFSMNGRVQKFNLPDINRFLKSYTPASITTGVADEVNFTGNVYKTNSSGTMKFLYHDLKADLDLKDQPKWKSDVLTFVGNTVVSSANPPAADKPAKIVKFKAERDMNKGFINIIIKSILSGFKETVMMSKENRKEYKKTKKEARRQARAEKKSKKND